VVATAVEVALGSLHLGQLRGMTQQQRMELSHHHTRYTADTLLVLLLLVDLWGQAGEPSTATGSPVAEVVATLGESEHANVPCVRHDVRARTEVRACLTSTFHCRTAKTPERLNDRQDMLNDLQ
jgi:hypothetical protein